MLGFSYGPKQTPVGAIPFTRDQWHTVTIEILWSQGKNGKAVVYFDDATKPVYSVDGPNMVNAYQHYMKIGQYRNPEIKLDNSVGLRNITVTKI